MADIVSQSLKVPPHDTDAEKSVLGALLLDNTALTEVLQFLKPEHFYIQEHRVIYAAIIVLFEKQIPIDVVTLKNQLKSEKVLKDVGLKTLTELVQHTPTAAHVEKYARIVKDHATKRHIITIASQATERAFDSSIATERVLDEVEADIFKLAEEQSIQDFVPLKNLLTESYDRLEKLSQSDIHLRGVPTGIPDLDMKLAGLQDSNLIILAARPGVGKTSFALNIALHAAYYQKMPVAFFSLEMSKEELVDRLLVTHADIDAWRLKTGRLSDEDFSSLTQAMGDLAEVPIFIDDTAGASIMEMRAKARKLKASSGIRMIIMDYLQLADPGKRLDSREQEVSRVSQGLKNLARELRVPVLALSQLSRRVEQRGTGAKPQLADLRESGAIEQDADVVMFIHQETEGDNLLGETTKKIMKLIIAKHRNGATGEVDVVFRGDRVRFYGVDKSPRDMQL